MDAETFKAALLSDGFSADIREIAPGHATPEHAHPFHVRGLVLDCDITLTTAEGSRTYRPGEVEWTGENPGISLKEDPAGPFTTLASFFRVMLSPHGRGHALVLMRAPQEGAPPAERANLCLTDNEPLARWLVANYVAHFGAWRGLPGLAGIHYRALDSVETRGDAITAYGETVRAGDLTVDLDWTGLGKPFCFALTPAQSATGVHHMPTLFVGCDRATVRVNGAARPGAPIPREIAGQRISTAMLAFSETWIRA